MNPWFLLARVGLTIAVFLGAWFYRGHIDAHETELALAKVAAESQKKVDLATAQADRDSRSLQAQADVQADRLKDQIDKSKAAYDAALLRAKLAHVPACPVPIAGIGVLFNPGREGGGATRENPAASGGRPQGGVVDATDIAVNAELNRGAFERNLDRLAECVGAYDRAIAIVNQP
jgi:hypothetical protein